jgi:hypothetical protein
MDEIDKFELKGDREAGALQNAEERTKSFAYPLRVKTSTPTTIHGEIHREFMLGDQRYFYLPCPLCKTMIRLLWPQVRWWERDESESKTDGDWDEEKVRRNTYYRCQECDGKIMDSSKTAMLRAGEWRPHNPRGMVGRRSYHLNSLYACLKETQWGILAVKWLQSKSSLSRRQAFINSTLAEPFDEERAVDDDPITVRTYTPSDLPAERIPIMTIDVQENHFWVVVRSWGNPKGPNGQESWLLFADRIETPEELEKLANDYGVEPRRVGLDMAHRPNMVSALLVKNDWRGLWGSDKTGFIHSLSNGNRLVREYSPIQYRDPHLGTIHQNENNSRAMFVYWSNDRIKDRLAVLRHTEPPRWHVHSNITKDYIHQINSEIKTTKVSPQTGKIKYYWRQMRKANHLFDCEAMQIVMALVGGILEDDSGKAATAQQPLIQQEENSGGHPAKPEDPSS